MCSFTPHNNIQPLVRMPDNAVPLIGGAAVPHCISPYVMPYHSLLCAGSPSTSIPTRTHAGVHPGASHRRLVGRAGAQRNSRAHSGGACWGLADACAKPGVVAARAGTRSRTRDARLSSADRRPPPSAPAGARHMHAHCGGAAARRPAPALRPARSGAARRAAGGQARGGGGRGGRVPEVGRDALAVDVGARGRQVLAHRQHQARGVAELVHALDQALAVRPGARRGRVGARRAAGCDAAR